MKQREMRNSQKMSLSNGNHWLVWGITLAFAVGLPVEAQSPSILQVPNVSVAAGIPGASPVPCSTSIPATNGTSYGDGCPATQATIGAALSMAVDSYGNIYFADTGHNAIRVVYQGNPQLAAAIVAAYANSAKVSLATIKTGYVYTLVGGCTGGFPGCFATITAAGGLGSGTVIAGPSGVTLDADGNVFFTDGQRIRIFYVGGTKAISLLKSSGLAVGGTGQIGYQYALIPGGSGSSSNITGYSGDGGPANSALLDTPRGLVVDANENLYFTDFNNHAVRKVTASTGVISTIVGGPGCVQGTPASCADTSTGDGGPATTASTAAPIDVLLDASGNLYVAEYDGLKVRVVYMGTGTLPGVTNPVTGNIYNVAGGGTTTTPGAAAMATKFGVVTGIGMDNNANLYVVDKGNHLWEIDHTTQVAVILGGGGTATVAGSACSSTNATGAKAVDAIGDGCVGTQAVLSTPFGHVPIDQQGNLYISDSGNNVLRVLSSHNLFPAIATGTTAPTQTYGFVSLATQTLGATGLVVQGSAGADFADAGSSTCVSGLALTPAKTCLLNVKFSPQLPGQREGGIAFTNASAAGIGGFFVGGTGTGAELVVDTGTQTSVGTNLSPSGMNADPAGNIYIADATSSSLLKFSSSTATTPTATLITGLSAPGQVVVDGQGNVAVADPGNNRIAVYNRTTQSVTSITSGLKAPQGVAVDALGDYFVADTGNNRIVEFLPAGTSRVLASSVSGPTRLSLDASGNLYVVDAGNHRVVAIALSTGTQTTITTLSYTPVDVALDAAGDLYVLDGGGAQVGVISPSGSSYTLLSGLKQPSSLAVDALGDVYVADSMAAGAIVLNRQNMVIDFGNVNLSSTSVASSFLLTSVGSQPVQFTNPGIVSAAGNTAVFTQGTSSNPCASPLASGARCSFNYTFTPASVTSYSSTLTFPSNASAADATTVKLQGAGVQLNNTSVGVTLVSPTNPATLTYGTPLNLSIALTVLTGTGTPTGTFTILVNGVKQTTVPIGTGTVTYSLTPEAGPLAISAVYSGDNAFASSNMTLNLSVAPVQTTTALTFTNNLSNTPPSVLLSAQVSSTITGVGGSVNFYNGTTLLGSGTTNTQGVATLTINNPAFATFSLTAQYQGNADFAPSTSNAQTLMPDFAFTPSLQMDAVQGGIATGSFVVTPYFGLSGTVQFSCSGLPVDSICRAFPQTVVLTGANDPPTTVQLQIFTGISPNTALHREAPSIFPGKGLGGVAMAMGCLILFRRRRFLPRVWLAVMTCGALLTCVSGCSSGNANSPTYSTPLGTYPVTLTASIGGVQHVSNISLIVQAR